MIWPALVCSLGLPAGFLLMGSVPLCRNGRREESPEVSVIIPARNEEHNLPGLLASIRNSGRAVAEVIVVDDGSSDGTAGLARRYGARVIRSEQLPRGWTGKTWACAQGAAAAHGDLLLFLDADTWFVANGCEKMLALYAGQADAGAAVSVLPWHVTERWYEQLSLFFNLLMAAGAGGFGIGGRCRLFGQSLLIAREMYERSGGHSGVRGSILENFKLAKGVEAAGGRTVCRGGRGTLAMRMFPEGYGQMCEGWTKAFVEGAADSGVAVLGFAIVWISALFSTFFLLIAPADYGRISLALVYLLYAAQLAWFARQVGNYRGLTCLLYPLPLTYYCAIFGLSLYRRALGRSTVWRGRAI